MCGIILFYAQYFQGWKVLKFLCSITWTLLCFHYWASAALFAIQSLRFEVMICSLIKKPQLKIPLSSLINLTRTNQNIWNLVGQSSATALWAVKYYSFPLNLFLHPLLTIKHQSHTIKGSHHLPYFCPPQKSQLLEKILFVFVFSSFLLVLWCSINSSHLFPHSHLLFIRLLLPKPSQILSVFFFILLTLAPLWTSFTPLLFILFLFSCSYVFLQFGFFL